jgi:hypothetical protein
MRHRDLMNPQDQGPMGGRGLAKRFGRGNGGPGQGAGRGRGAGNGQRGRGPGLGRCRQGAARGGWNR